MLKSIFSFLGSIGLGSWLKIGLVVIFVALLGFALESYHYLYNDNKKQATELVEKNNQIAVANNNALVFHQQIDDMNKSIEDLASRNAILESDVKAATIKIGTLRGSQSKMIEKLVSVPVPTDCEAKLQYLREQAKILSSYKNGGGTP